MMQETNTQASTINASSIEPLLSSIPSLEKKAYGPDISPQEEELLNEQVFIYEDNIIYYREAPIITTYQLNVYKKKIDELAKKIESFYVIVDLTHAAPPGPNERYFLKDFFSTYKGLKHLSVFTNKNFILGIAAKFVIRSFGKEFSVHKTFNQALKKIYQLKNEEESRRNR